MTGTVRASSSAKDEAPPSTPETDDGLLTGAGVGALNELLPKKLERGKLASSLFGFYLLQLTIAGSKTLYEAAISSLAAGTAALTV